MSSLERASLRQKYCVILIHLINTFALIIQCLILCKMCVFYVTPKKGTVSYPVCLLILCNL